MTEEELERSWPGLSRALLTSAGFPEAKRCDWSDLLPSACAHCLGHDQSDFIIKPQKDVIYG